MIRLPLQYSASVLALFSSLVGCIKSNKGEVKSVEAPSCKVDKDLVDLVENFNADAWNFTPGSRVAQIGVMRKGAAEFYRLTPYLFYGLVQKKAKADADFAKQLSSIGEGPTYADLHPLNVAWKEKKDGKVVAWVNDFDDVSIAPLMSEVLRSVTAVLVFVPGANAKMVAENYIRSYFLARSGSIDGENTEDIKTLSKLPPDVEDEKDPIEQPEMSKNALKDVTQVLEESDPKHLKKVEECKVVYKAIAGGSSIGLPHFRFKCKNEIVFEIKAARKPSWDAALSGGLDKNPSKHADRLVSLANQLAAPEAEKFIFYKNVSKEKWVGPWSYFIHERLGNSFGVQNLNESNAVVLGSVLGGLAGTGHKRAGAQVVESLNMDAVTSFVTNAASEFAAQMNQLQQSLPPCLEGKP